MCFGGIWTEGGFTLTLFHGWGGWSEVLLEQVQLNFSFRNKFKTVFSCGLLVDNNTFSKMCVFKSLTDYTDDGGYENRNVHFYNKIKVNEDLMLVILNCILLHNQNYGNCTSRHFRRRTYEISGSLIFVEKSVHTKLARPTRQTKYKIIKTNWRRPDLMPTKLPIQWI